MVPSERQWFFQSLVLTTKTMKGLFKSKPLTTPEIVCQTRDIFLYEEKVSSLPCFFLLGSSLVMPALVTRLHDVKISFFASDIKGIYLNKRIEKKNLRYFRQCLLRLHRNSKRKKENIHRFDHIQSFNKYSIFSFKSQFMSLILEASQH